MKKVTLSGIKPTGRPHLGNYFGAMRQFVELQNQNSGTNYFFVADYHALNLIQDAKQLRELSFDVIVDFLAIGLDPKKSIIFKFRKSCSDETYNISTCGFMLKELVIFVNFLLKFLILKIS
jgi:tryptophanyl-tRNA synthetase